MKKFVPVCFVTLFALVNVYAGGSKDVTVIDINSKDSWQETVDISQKKKGKYNVLITAADVAGNMGQHGPFNLYIDPSSDLPVVNINNPAAEARVTSTVVDVVGTCLDDDGIDYVEIKIDDEEEVYRAKGKEFWSYYINTANLTEGPHTVEACGVDINGVRGLPVKTKFYFDRNPPDTKIVNKGIGELVSGKIRLEGVVEDGNGIKQLFYSLDNGEHFQEVKLSYNKKDKISTFKLNIDTTKIPDGPSVCWFKSVDKMDSTGLYTFLFFVDNTPPEVEFVWPKDNTVQPGSVFSVAGKWFDTVGLESLKWVCGKESGEFEIMPGNRYWVKEFDFSKTGGKSVTVEIIATDVAGNVIKKKKSISLDKAQDKPVLELFSPAASGKVTGVLNITGAVSGRPGSFEIKYTLDKGEEKTAVTDTGVFKITESDVSDGSHKLKIYAVSSAGIQSNVLHIGFVAEDVSPEAGVPKITLTVPENRYYVKDSISFSGSVSDPEGVYSVDYVVGGNTPVGVTSPFKETVDISALPDGPIVLAVKAVSSIGKEVTEYTVFYKDTEAPEAVIVLPEESDNVNGSIIAAFSVKEKAGGVKAEYRASEKSGQWQAFDSGSLPNIIIGTAKEPINKGMAFRFTDTAGNAAVIDNYNFNIDNTADTPVVELNLPIENDIIIKDFEISGIAHDDDAPAKVYYKIDNEAYKSVDIKHSFTIPVSIGQLTDNEHTITVYAEDVYGVKSEPVSRKIRVSVAPPVITIASPKISETVKEHVVINGTAVDKNGIKRVEISVDNGNTYSFTEGLENWSYSLNTFVIDDGTHVIFVKAVDNYGQESITSTLMTVDNTPPVLKFEYPLSGGSVENNLFVSGQTTDNISLEGVMLKIKSLDGNSVPSNLTSLKLGTDLLVAKDIDISGLREGRYNLEISGVDKANNVTEIAINFEVSRKKDNNRIEVLYPLDGETVCGEFNVYGRIVSTAKIEEVSLYIDGSAAGTSPVSKTGYAAFKVNPELISDGVRKIEIKGVSSENKSIVSNVHNIQYRTEGPWITVDNLAMGDFAVDRPYLMGRAGYSFSKEAEPADKQTVKAKTLKKVEVSFNNGKTFFPAKLRKGWRYRIETEDLAEGNHFLLIRATLQDKQVALCRTIVRVDRSAPSITLISPGVGGRYNETMVFRGAAADDIGVSEVKAYLRKGDKAFYGLPKFIQGLHVELGFWGASLWNMGLGLSFFDNNVKVQFHYGQFTQGQFDAIYGTKYGKTPIRYGGHIVSLKLLANIYTLPFGNYCGPDWKWLYMSIAVGTQFSLFTDTQSGKPQVLAAMLAQLEFPKVKFHKRKYISAFSIFTEGQLWFIPTDVTSKGGRSTSKIRSVVPHFSAGIRMDIF